MRDAANVLAVKHLIRRLEKEDPRNAKILKLRVYEGFTIRQTAKELGISQSTVKVRWNLTRQWLYGHLTVRPTRAVSNGRI